MANETYLKPHGVAFNGDIKKVDRIDTAEAATGKALYGDNAVWPTANRRHLRNARVTIQTRDHAAYDARYLNETGNLTFSVLVEKTGAVVAKTFANLILVDKSRALGGDVDVATLVFEVEVEDGVTGPWS